MSGLTDPKYNNHLEPHKIRSINNFKILLPVTRSESGLIHLAGETSESAFNYFQSISPTGKLCVHQQLTYLQEVASTTLKSTADTIDLRRLVSR
jgi:hypothetical protein